MPGVQPLTLELFRQEVRAFMRDWEQINRLISGEETGNRLIEYCIFLAIDEYNSTPPLTSHSIVSFPSRFVLLYLSIIHVLTSVGLLKSRNRFNYSDGGFSVQTETQDELYQRWIQLFRSQVDPKLQNLKVAINIESGWGGGVGSEYGWIHGWYGLS